MTLFIFVTSFISIATPSRAEEVTLKLVMTSYQLEMRDYYDNIIQRFETENPGIKVNIELVTPAEIGQRVKTLIETGQSPDIVNSGDYATEAAAGLLYRADKIVDSSVLKDFFPALIDNSKYKGTAYAIPDLVSTRSFAWNKTMLSGAKVKKAPTTWPEMLSAAKAIRKAYPDRYAYCLPLGPEEAQMILTTWGGVNGGRLFDFKLNRYTINTKEFKEALDFLKNLVDRKLTQPNPGETNRSDGCWARFAKGEVAMVDGSVSFPDWLAKNGGENIDFAQGPFPHATGKKSITVGMHGYFKGYKANGHQPEIQKFLTFLFEPTNYQSFLKAAGTFNPAIKSVGALLDNDPRLGSFSKQSSSMIFYPDTVNSWPSCKSVIVTYMRNAMANTAKALFNIQARCDAFQTKSR